jgi:hypothetical protein
MADIVPYAMWAVLIVTMLSLAAIALFGVRSLVQGKLNPLTVGLTMVPVLIFGALGLVMGDWAEAAIVTVLISLGLTAGVLLLSGLKGLFGM